jgi:hypothetical protein
MEVFPKWHPLTQSELKTAFDKAREDGKDFLMVVVHSTPDVQKFGMLLNIHETPVGLGKDTIAEEVREISKKFGLHFNIGAVYAVGPAFEAAQKGWVEIMPVDVLQVREQLIVENEQAQWDARPWYSKLFSSRPEAAPL